MDPEEIDNLAFGPAEEQTEMWNAMKAFEEARMKHGRTKRNLKKNITLKRKSIF